MCGEANVRMVKKYFKRRGASLSGISQTNTLIKGNAPGILNELDITPV